MSVLYPGDERYHYSDNSHRWIAPSDDEQERWETEVRVHLVDHLRTQGGPPAMARDEIRRTVPNVGDAA